MGSFFILLGINDLPGIYNEGLALTGSRMVSNGYLPYKDFWSIISPAQFYLNSILSSFSSDIFQTIKIIRIFTFLEYLFISLLIFNIAERTITRKYAIIPAFSSLIIFTFINLWGRAIPSGILLAFLASYYLFNYFETAKIRYAYQAGFAIGALALFRHDMGGFLLGAIFQAIFFFSLSHGIIREAKRKEKIIYGLKNALKFGVAAFWPLPIAIFFLLNAGFDNIWTQLIEVPATTFREFRALPFPFPWDALQAENTLSQFNLFWNGTVFWIPVLTLILTVLMIIVRVRSKKLILNGEKFWKEITLFNIGMNLFNQASIRSDFEHLIPVLLPALILIVNLILMNKNKFLRYFLVIVIFGFILIAPIFKLLGKRQTEFTKEYTTVINELKDYESDFISLNKRNDKAYINDVLIYYLTNRIPPTKYYELHPGITTTETFQKRIINDLEEKKVMYVFITDLGNITYEYETEENESTVLDKYIKDNFEIVYKNAPYMILKKLEK